MLERTKMLPIEVGKNSKNSNRYPAKDNWRELFKDRIAKKTEQGLFLTGLRRRDGYTQRQLGDLIGVSQTNICAMENGRRTIGKNIAQKLAAIFKVNYQQFL